MYFKSDEPIRRINSSDYNNETHLITEP